METATNSVFNPRKIIDTTCPDVAETTEGFAWEEAMQGFVTPNA